MSSTRIESLVDDVQAAFDSRPTEIETGLDIEDAALLQLRKGVDCSPVPRRYATRAITRSSSRLR